MSIKELKECIVAAGLSHADCSEKSELQARAASALGLGFKKTKRAPQQVIISGASGNNAAFVNGSFLCVDELYNGRALYRKEGDPNAWLCYCMSSKWAVSTTADKVANNDSCYAHSVNMDMAFATGESLWNVFADGKWVEQKAVRMSPAV
jgi:hypothetical protein